MISAGDFFFVFDRTEFESSNEIMINDYEDDTLDIILKNCFDHTDTERGKKALSHYAEEYGLGALVCP